MQRYESYKPSGADWIGDIPAHWSVTPAKRLFREISEKNHPDAELLSVTQELGVVPRSKLEQRVVMPTGQLKTFKLVRSGDFVISLRSFQGGIEHSNYTGLVSPAYTVLRMQREANPHYLKHLLKSAPFISELNTAVTGIREGKNISFSEMAYSLLPLPPLEEQDRIVAFLDQKTNEIDAAIAKKERMIELLGEQRSILINQAVTSGLDQSAPLKKGVSEWIECVPEHWEIVPLKYVSKVQSGLTLGKHHAPSKATKSFPYLRVANVQDGYIDLSTVTEIVLPIREAKNYRLLKGDILVTEGGDIDKLGRGNCWGGQIDECLHQNHVFAVRILKRVRSEFVALITGVTYARRYFTTTANKTTNLASTNKTKLGNLPVVVPPLPEQDAILEFCNSIKAQYESVINSVSSEISALKAMKSSVVSDAVTGRIKI